MNRIPKLNWKRNTKKKRIRLGKGRYIFTDNKHPVRGVFSAFLGILSLVAIYMAVRRAAFAGGVADGRDTMTVILAGIYALAGLVLGIMSRREKDIFKLFPNLGIISNVLAIIIVASFLYLSWI